MAGGFAVIKDVPKTLVYELVRAPQRSAPAATGDPASRDRARPLGRAAPRPARRGLAAALRDARPDPRGATSSATAAASEIVAEGFDRETVERGDPSWSTAPSTSAARRRPGIKITAEGLRPRPAPADHQPLRRLVGLSCGGRAHGDRHRARRRRAGRRRRAARPSQTQVVRPRCSAWASACTEPLNIGRRNEVSFGLPEARRCRRADGLVGSPRGERLRERRVGAAVDDPVRLQDVRVDRQPHRRRIDGEMFVVGEAEGLAEPVAAFLLLGALFVGSHGLQVRSRAARGQAPATGA